MENSNSIAQETKRFVEINPKAKFSIKDTRKYGAVIQTLADFQTINGGIIEIEAILENAYEKLERECLSAFLSFQVIDDGYIEDLKFSLPDNFAIPLRENGKTGMGIYRVEDALHYLAEKYPKYISIHECTVVDEVPQETTEETTEKVLKHEKRTVGQARDLVDTVLLDKCRWASREAKGEHTAVVKYYGWNDELIAVLKYKCGNPDEIIHAVDQALEAISSIDAPDCDQYIKRNQVA